MTPEQTRAQLIHDQDQEWAEARTWYRDNDKTDLLHFVTKITDGTRAAVERMSDAEIAACCRLAVLALGEVIGKETDDALGVEQER